MPPHLRRTNGGKARAAFAAMLLRKLSGCGDNSISSNARMRQRTKLAGTPRIRTSAAPWGIWDGKSRSKRTGRSTFLNKNARPRLAEVTVNNETQHRGEEAPYRKKGGGVYCIGRYKRRQRQAAKYLDDSTAQKRLLAQVAIRYKSMTVTI